MKDLEKLKRLMKQVANGEATANYSNKDLEKALRERFRELAKDYYTYKQNRYYIFELISSTLDEVMPNRVIDSIGQFSDVRSFAQGQRPVFKIKTGRQRGKRFITQVGLSGLYEVFRLDSREIEVPAKAYGGAAIVELEEWLDGRVDFTELTQIVIEEVADSIYYETIDAITSAVKKMPSTNRKIVNGFDHAEMTELINLARAYGTGVNLFCSPEFAGTIEPSAHYGPVAFSSEQEALEMREKGYLGMYKGAPVIALPQSFEDRENKVKVMNPGLGFVIPTGGDADERIAKVNLEGESIIDEYTNYDKSMEIQVYKKFGVSVLTTNYFGVYQNSDLYTDDDGWVEDASGVYVRG